MTDVELAARFFLQVAVILTACRLVGWLGRLAGQTQVVSEMIAGVLLGPSLLGLLLPEAQAWLFPQVLETPAGDLRHPSMTILYAASQLGLVLYMFLIGLEFDTGLLRLQAKSAFSVSASGVVVPFALGAGAAVLLRDRYPLFAPEAAPLVVAVFLGASMCITAFPMLARILHEQGIARTPMGTLALAAGAADDALAWCLLAIVLAMFKGDPQIALWAIGGGGAYALLMLTVGKRALVHLARWTERSGSVTPPIFGTALLVLMLGAFTTDTIGIYAVFGAFLVGLAMPRGLFAEQMRGHLEFATSGLLLPLFFVFSGLNTRVGLLDSPALWGVAALLTFLAIAGKGGACTLASRASGESWRDSLAIGSLMNARGLMELIILNIGLQAGVITPTLFTMLVLMAIVTTLMASPIFAWVMRVRTPTAA